MTSANAIPLIALRAITRVCLCMILFTASTIAAEEPSVGAVLKNLPDVQYPPSHAVVDVSKAPYFAKGDGVADDTEAIQKALSDVMGQHKLLYFPKGTYLISKTLMWSKKNSSGKEAWGFNFLQGQNAESTIIQLKDSTFTDTTQPSSLMWCGGFGSADWFHNYVQGLTFDVGSNNPAAIGLQFYSNNSGAVRNCRFVAGEGSGWIGLDLSHRDMNGPLLVQNCEVTGFNKGIHTANAVNGQTFEHITLRNQKQFGFDNEGQTVSIRGLYSESLVPAVRSYGVVCLLDSQLKGLKQSEQWPAIVNYNGGRIFVRDVQTSGYRRAIGDVATPDWFAATRISAEEPKGLGPKIVEYCSHEPTFAFPSSPRSMRLAIKEPPKTPVDPPSSWADVDSFGADPTGSADSSEAFQKAVDSGASTIFLPGSYALRSTVTIRGKVRRIVGVGGMIDYAGATKPDFRIEDGDLTPVTFEHIAHVHGGVEVNSKRTVIFRSVSDCDLVFGPKAQDGLLYFEDFVTHNLRLSQQSVWACQLNVENEGTHIENDGGRLWILGYKTERGGTLIETRLLGQSEVLGGFSYTTTAGKLAPMFVTEDASIFTFFNEVCFNGDPFAVRIKETRKGESKILTKDEGQTLPYSGHQSKQ